MSLGDAEFAASIGVSRQAVHRYKTGDRVPEWAVLGRIKDITNGMVTPDDFLGNAPPPATEPAQAAS